MLTPLFPLAPCARPSCLALPMTAFLHPTQHIFGKDFSQHSPISHAIVEDPAFKDEEFRISLFRITSAKSHSVCFTGIKDGGKQLT